MSDSEFTLLTTLRSHVDIALSYGYCIVWSGTHNSVTCYRLVGSVPLPYLPE